MIQNKLLKWFDLNKRDLPWRHGRNPYRVWVAEIMLQQTQVKTVIPYFKKWMKKYPTLKSLRNAEYDKVLKMWEGLGYYSRCKNMHKASKLIESSFPNNYEDLRKLPGVGDYTAKTILSIAFDKPFVGIDTNLAPPADAGFKSGLSSAIKILIGNNNITKNTIRDLIFFTILDQSLFFSFLFY